MFTCVSTLEIDFDDEGFVDLWVFFDPPCFFVDNILVNAGMLLFVREDFLLLALPRGKFENFSKHCFILKKVHN